MSTNHPGVLLHIATAKELVARLNQEDEVNVNERWKYTVEDMGDDQAYVTATDAKGHKLGRL